MEIIFCRAIFHAVNIKSYSRTDGCMVQALVNVFSTIEQPQDVAMIDTLMRRMQDTGFMR